MKYTSASVLLLAALAAAQQWEVELVDPSSCAPKEVFVRRDSGLTYIAYLTAAENIRIARKDTIWGYEDLDTGLVRPSPYSEFHFALGPLGRMAVSGVDDSVRPMVVEKSDTGWVSVWTHEMLSYYAPLARAAYGDDSTPIVMYCANDYTSADIVVEARVDSVWQVDTAAHFDPGSPNECQLTLYDADGSPEAGPCFLIRYAYGLPFGAEVPWTYSVVKGYLSGDSWILVGLGGGWNVHVYGYDIAAGTDDTVRAAVYYGGYLRFDQDSVWPELVTDASIQVDREGREQIAFVTQDGILRFAFRDPDWHFCEVTGVTTATCCDLALDSDGQPLIAFEGANGLSLARGVDVVGIEESPKPQVSGRKLATTVIRSLPAGAVAFDAMGRRVVDPRSGIFFVREAQAQTVRKVVIQH